MSESEKPTIHAEKAEAPKCPLCQADLSKESVPPLTPITCPACAGKIIVPGMLGGFRLIRLIGCGGMGGVYEAFDESLKRKVAIKVILRTMTNDPTFIETFRREAQSAARLNHPHIVQIYSFGEICDQPYIVMELVQPDSLDRMMKNGPVSQSTVLRVGEEVAEGLKQASEMGIVHGDVKPENILVDENRNAKLADFGIAALAGARAGAENEVWGTPYYIAPETLRRQKVDHRADIYSLGGTLYHAIAGVPPFEGADAIAVMKARLESTPRPLKDIVPGIPENLNALIMRMLASEPSQRYPTYESLIGDIRNVQATLKPAPLAGKRVVIKGKTPITPSARLSVPAGITRSGQGDILDPMSLEQFKTVKPEDEAQAGARRVKMFIIGACVVLMAFAGLIALIVMVMKESSKPKAINTMIGNFQNEQDALEGQKALEQIKQHQAELQVTIARLNDAVTQTAPMMAEIVRDVKRGTRPQYHAFAAPKEPEHAIYLPILPPAPAPEAEAPAPAAEPEQAAPEEAPAPAAAEQPAEPEPVAPAEELPRLTQRSIDLHNRFYALKENLLCAQDLAAWLETQVMMATDKTITTAALKKMEKNIAYALTEFNKRPDAADSKAAVESIDQHRQRINSEYRQAIQEIRKEDEARRIAAQKAKEEENKRLEQERYAQLEQNEVEAAGMALNEIYADLQAFEFDAALRKFNLRTGDFKTEKGKAATAVPLEKIERLRSLQTFLAQRMPTFKGPTAYSVAKINKDRIFMRGNEKPFPWAEITQKRPEVMVAQIRYFLIDEERAKSLKLSERANQSINAALFCKWMIPGNNPTVEKISTTLLDYASRNLPSAQADIARIFESTP